MFSRVGARLARAAVASSCGAAASSAAGAVTGGSGGIGMCFGNNNRIAAGSLSAMVGRRVGGGGGVGGCGFGGAGAAARRGCASESAAKEAAVSVEENSVIGNVIDTVTTAGTVAGMAVMGAVGVSYYVQTTEELEKTVEKGEHVPSAIKGTPLQQAVDYVFVNLVEFRQWADGQAHFFLDPVSDKLLPDHPANATYIPHTLVMDLDDTLILSDWTRERGWRVFKRPGADDFIKHMAQFYEVIVYSDQMSTYVDPIVERLDPNHFLAGRLYREATQYKNGDYLRDFTKLNRDVGKVIYITARPKTAMQQENVIVINPYRIRGGGDGGGGGGGGGNSAASGPDTTLLDMMPFLESIVRLNVKDVRDVINSYKQEAESTGKSIPEIFRSRQVAFQQAQRDKSKSRPRFSRGYDFGRGR